MNDFQLQCEDMSDIVSDFVVILSLSLHVIVIMGASVDSMCHELSEYVWSYGSVKHI